MRNRALWVVGVLAAAAIGRLSVGWVPDAAAQIQKPKLPAGFPTAAPKLAPPFKVVRIGKSTVTYDCAAASAKATINVTNGMKTEAKGTVFVAAAGKSGRTTFTIAAGGSQDVVVSLPGAKCADHALDAYTLIEGADEYVPLGNATLTMEGQPAQKVPG